MIRISLILTLLMTSSATFCQSNDILERANEAFEKGLYAESLQMFSAILANGPKDPELNYKYGASFVFVGDYDDPQDALKYLQYAYDNGFEDDRFYYFSAVAHERTGNYGMAIEFYYSYLDERTNENIKKSVVKKRIKNCKKALKKQT